MRIATALASTILVLGIAGGTAHADSKADSKRAAQSFAVGKAAYARGEFSAAAAAFEQAAFYAPHPAPLLNAAEAWELANNPVRAAQVCDRVLDLPDIDQKYRQAALQQLSRVTTKITTVDVKVPEGTRLVVQGEQDDAVGRKLRLTPGAHTIVATYKDGETRSETVSLNAGASKELDMSAPTVAKAAPIPPRAAVAVDTTKVKTGGSGPPLGSWISFGIAAASGGVATFYGLRTVDAKQKFDADAHPTVQMRDDFKSARLMTNVFIGVAVVSAAVGAVLWIYAPKGSAETTKKAQDAAMGIVRF